MEVVCERVDAEAPAPEQEPPPAPEPETPKSRGRPKGAPNKVKEPKAPPPPEPVPAPKVKRENREKPETRQGQRAASPPPFEPTFEELLGHMGRAMAQQRAVRAQARLDLYSQFLS